MGAGKTTLGPKIGRLLGRPFRDVDEELAAALAMPVADFWAEHGEEAFRVREAELTLEALRATGPSVLALGGGAVTQPAVRAALREHAVTVLLDVDADTAWQRVRATDRPLAREQGAFVALYERAIRSTASSPTLSRETWTT